MADEIVPHATDKKSSKRDAEQAMRMAFNDSDHTLGVNGFLVMAVGRRIVTEIATTNVTDDTAIFHFYQNHDELLYSLQVVFTDGLRTDFLEAERIA